MDTPRASTLHEFRENGYVLLRNCISDHALERVRGITAAHVDVLAEKLRGEGKIQDLRSASPFESRLYEIYRGLSERPIGAWNQEVFGEEVYELGMQAGILDTLEGILGPEIQFNGDYWIRPKLPFEDATTVPWHQDSGYYDESVKAREIVSLWIPLVDVDRENGCLELIPRSHTWGLLPYSTDARGHHRPIEELEKRGRPVALPMKTGDMLAFHSLTFHRSLMNNSRGVRWSIDLRYSTTDVPMQWLWRSGLNGFVARSKAEPGSVHTWSDWRKARQEAVTAAAAR